MPSVLQSFSDDLSNAVSRVGASVVAIHARRRIPSSGVLWRPGVVVTAHHTVHQEEGITVSLPGGATAAATLAGRDPTTDLAALRITGDGQQIPEIAGGEEISVGQLVLALGRPGPEVTATLGIVSAVGGEWRTWHGGRINRYVRLDLSIYDGFSGGPLVDARARVLGINTSGLARAAAMTVPAATVDRVLDQLLSGGRVRRGWLGLGMQPVRLAGDRKGGLMVVSVADGSPASRAGVLLGDIVVDFDGVAVSDPTELLVLLSDDRIGKRTTARVIRAGEPRDITLTVGERPSR
jgi:S1-C subfamily serine protease